MANQPDNKLEDLTKGFSDFKAVFSGFREKFDAVRNFVTWCAAALVALAVTIAGLVYSHGEKLAGLEANTKTLNSSVEELKHQFEDQSGKVNTAVKGFTESTQGLANAAEIQSALESAFATFGGKQVNQLGGIKQQIIDETSSQRNWILGQIKPLKEILKDLGRPPVEELLRIAFTRENFKLAEGNGLHLEAPLPARIDLTDREKPSVRVQSLDIPGELGTYQSSAALSENGEVCQLTIFTPHPEQIKDRLFTTGISASFLITIPPLSYSSFVPGRSSRLATLALYGQ